MENLDYAALVLAGGKGERLGVLTQKTPKPAITFGGVHRLIDFTLSNCKYSGIGVIGVITQYCGHELDGYIGCGTRWLPESARGKIVTLPPQARGGKTGFYNGTADAVLQNAAFVERHNPENILVLSGDHVYKMNYADMIKAHEHSGAAATIAAIQVPAAEASRFGIMETDKNNVITGFEEKPARPKSSLASMGVYVFNWAALKRHLIKTRLTAAGSMDIGKDIIPGMLMSGEKLCAYRFGEYWKDVGTIYSLWEANMELLSDPPSIGLHDDNWKIISRGEGTLLRHSRFDSGGARIANSFVADGCVIRGTVEKSIISDGVEIGDGARIIDSVIMPGAKIGRSSSVTKAIVGPNSVVGDRTVIGGIKPDGKHLDYCQGISVVGGDSSVFARGDGRLACAAISPVFM